MSDGAPATGGLRLKDRYVVEKELGRGGIGVVYLARDEQLHSRPVVIKVLLDQTADSDWFQKKFRGELEALVRIDHPGVVGALDAGQMPDGQPFLVMQFVPGTTLRGLMKGALLDFQVVSDIVRQVAAALSAAHEAGVHHRDLKPENIMVRDTGHGERQVKIIDFGIATVRDPAQAGTQVTEVAGSVKYMAPEQLMGRPQAASDIYALAVIAYELLTGTVPFRPESPYELLGLQRNGLQHPPSGERPELSPAVDAVVVKSLAFEPHSRHLTAWKFGEELTAALAASVPWATAPASAAVATRHDAVTRPTLGTTAVPPITSHTTARPEPTAGPALPAAGATAVDPPLAPGPAPAPRTKGASGARMPATASVGEDRRSKMPLAVGVGALVLALVAGAAFYIVGGGGKPPDGVVVSTTLPPKPPAPPAVERELAYYLTVQKYQAGKPYREPFRLAREMLFGPEDRLRVTVSSPQPGYLYIVNEGPDANGAITYNVLHPRATSDGGGAALPAGREVHIPAADRYFQFDLAQGTESLWLVFAAEAVPELEAVKGVANPVDRGVVRDAAQLQGLRSFLDRHRAQAPRAAADEASRRSVLRSPDAVLVSLLKLEHM
jgi:predicted Ser/Thr protein kinase